MSVDPSLESDPVEEEPDASHADGTDSMPSDDGDPAGPARRALGVLLTSLAVWGAGSATLTVTPGDSPLPAVWPAAGIALGAVLCIGPIALLGIAAGSFAAFLDLAISSTEAIPIAGVLSLVACGQAWVAATLVRSTIDRADPIAAPLDIARFFGVGVACCALGAVAVAGAFSRAGGVPYGSTGLTAFSWWVAEAIGVVVFAPLVLGAFARPRFAWRPRLWIVGAPLLAVSVIVVLAYVSAVGRDDERQERVFNERARAIVEDLQVRVGQYEFVLMGIERLYAASERVDDDEFERFVSLSLARCGGIRALLAFEREEPATGLEGFAVRKVAPSDSLEGRAYFEATAVEVRTAMFEQAAETGMPAASPRIELPPSGSPGVLMAVPIYERDAAHVPSAVRAFAVGIVDVAHLVDEALAGTERSNVGIAIRDAAGLDADAIERSRLFEWRPEAFQAPDAQRVVLAESVTLGGRDWEVQLTSERRRGWFTWWVLAAGLWLVAVLGAILLLSTGRSAAIERLVGARTAQLAEANVQLGEEIDEHMHTEKRLRSHAYQLARSNEELDTLTYIATNDLKPDLAKIDGLAGQLADDASGVDGLPEIFTEHLASIRERVGRASTLLDDLLDYSKVNRVLHDHEPIAIEEMLQQSVTALDVPDGFRICAHGLPILEGEREPLDHVFRNLIANAIEHHDRDRGRIDISCRYADDRVEFVVADDGPGIPADRRARLFELYRTEEGEERASRLGLALVKKLVEQRRGTLHVECGTLDDAKEAGRGTTVRFTWPLGAMWDE